MNSTVHVLAAYDGDLYAGGVFISAGGVSALRIARWTGSAWASLGPEGTGASGDVLSLAVFEPANATASLYIGGTFTQADGMTANNIARWDGSQWSDVDGGVTGTSGPAVRALAVFDPPAKDQQAGDGSGPALYVSGTFTSAGVGPSAITARLIAKWRPGEGWSAVGGGMIGSPASVDALVVFDDGDGPALYAGGSFNTAGGVPANNVARWDGNAWTALGDGVEGGPVRALAVFDDGSGPALYAGGTFTTAGGAPANRVARWDGTQWHPLGNGVTGGLLGVMGMVAYDDGSPFAAVNGGNGALFVAGGFNTAGGVSANNIARWNGQEWAAVGTGLSGGPLPTGVGLAVHDGPLGPALYVGGLFTAAGSQSAANIARWSPTAALEIIDHPQSVTVESGASALMSVTADGAAPITYQWRRNGMDLADDQRISGATTPNLSIDPVQSSDDGVYDVLVSNVCGPLPSGEAVLTVTPRLGDLNGDDLVDVLDLLILLDAWGACKDCENCPADLNGDCAVDVLDLLILLDNWG